MIRVNIQQAKTHLSRYISRVKQGDVVVVCRQECDRNSRPGL